MAPTDLTNHLADGHGIPHGLLNQHTPEEHAVWHDAEHRTRRPPKRGAVHSGYLRHHHDPDVKPGDFSEQLELAGLTS